MAVELDARAAGARRLKGKVCVVTGAGQGIGRATARRLGQEGGKIARVRFFKILQKVSDRSLSCCCFIKLYRESHGLSTPILV